MTENKQLLFAQHIRDLMENLPAILAKLKIDADMHKTKFDALIKAGFNRQEALELCKILL